MRPARDVGPLGLGLVTAGHSLGVCHRRLTVVGVRTKQAAATALRRASTLIPTSTCPHRLTQERSRTITCLMGRNDHLRFKAGPVVQAAFLITGWRLARG